MKKQNILKKISLLVLSVFMVNSVAMADGEPKKVETCLQLSNNNLTNTKKHKKNTSKNVFGTLLILGVLCVVDKAHDIADWLIGDPYFKIGIVLYESEKNPEMFTEVQILSNEANKGIPSSYKPKENKFEQIDRDLNQEEGIMAQNISDMMASIGSLDGVEEQKTDLQSHAEVFKNAAKRLRKNDARSNLHIFHGWINQLSEEERKYRIKLGKQYAQEHPAKAAAMLKNWPKFFTILIKKLKGSNNS